MALRISNIRLHVDEPESLLPERLARVLGLRPEALLHWRILRKSLDARDKDALQFVYSAVVSLPEDESRVAALARRVSRPAVGVEDYAEEPFHLPPPGDRPLAHRPVVIGSGPAGLLAAY